MSKVLHVAVALLVLAIGGWPARAQDAAPATPAPTGYTRVREADDGTLVLELAARTFAVSAREGEAPRPRVLLVSAIHIGEPAYYESLQALLDAQGLVLFEGVRPPGAGGVPADADDAARSEITRGRLEFLKTIISDQAAERGSLPASFDEVVEHSGKRWRSIVEGSRVDAWSRPLRIVSVAADDEARRAARVTITSDGLDGVAGNDDDLSVECPQPAAPSARDRKSSTSAIQSKLASALGLVFQLDRMDSSKPNWQSSDMSIDELEREFGKAGADGSMLFKMLDGTSLVGALAGFLLDVIGQRKEMQAIAKMMLIETLAAADLAEGKLPKGAESMKKLMKVIIEERNAVVVRDLRAILDTRKDVPSIAIFYGAGHMADMERRLRDEFGYEPVETAWLKSMRVHPREAGLSKRQAKAMRDSMRSVFESTAK